MKPTVVVDVGNSRIKWGRCAEGAVVEHVSLPPDDPAAWQTQADAWNLDRSTRWAVCGVHPERREFLVKWLRQRGDTVVVIDNWLQVPLRVQVDEPDRVGIDRLLNALAANSWRRQGAAAVVIDAGTAVTVDCVDNTGAFRGGAIFPGLRLMAQALHEHTALLPLVRVDSDRITLPGRSTTAALEAGVFWAVVGGIVSLVEELSVPDNPAPEAITKVDIFLTGGDAALLRPTLLKRLKPLWSRDHAADVSVRVTAELGHITIPIRETLKFRIGDVVKLDRPISEPVDLMAQGMRLARGEVVVVDENFAVRIVEIVDSTKRGLAPWPLMTLEGIRLAAEAQP